MQYAWEKRESIENFGWTRLEGTDHLEELCVVGRVIM
jgi:hypothetical protein